MSASSRRTYLDWLRGLAVLIMIEAHLLDSWTRVPDRETRQFAYAMILGGFGAPLFLFLAGVAVPFSARSKLRRSGDAGLAARAVARRGLEIFGLAFLFRLQAMVLSWGSVRTILRVDILNVMGPSISACAALWALGRSHRGRLTLFAVATLAVAIATPLVRALPALGVLPDPIEAYIRPVDGLSSFVFLPWTAFVLAGGVVGLVLEPLQAGSQERRANLVLVVAGLAIAYGAYRASFLPALFAQSHFWTTSPSFLFLRLGILVAAVGLAYLWESRPGAAGKWSPLRQLGRTSLFIYWIHVEMVYGLVSLGLHKRLSWGQSWIALFFFCLFMLLCSLAKDRLVAWRQRRSRGSALADRSR
jgi:uncharacterized membrane protein